MLLVLSYIRVYMPKTLLFVLFTSFCDLWSLIFESAKTVFGSSRSVVLFNCCFYLPVFYFLVKKKKIIKKSAKKCTQTLRWTQYKIWQLLNNRNYAENISADGRRTTVNNQWILESNLLLGFSWRNNFRSAPIIFSLSSNLNVTGINFKPEHNLHQVILFRLIGYYIFFMMTEE